MPTHGTAGDPTYVVAEDMRALPRELRKEMRPKLRKAGEVVVRDARARARWSTRIPGTIRIRTSFRVHRESVEVIAGGKRAPHARPYEGLSRDPFRHPLFGNREAWVSQPARPFLLPAAKAKRGEVDAAIKEAFDAAPKGIGF